MEKKLGKIQKIRFGHGGYQGSMLGLSVTLYAEGWCVDDFKGAYDPEIVTIGPSTQWTEEDREKDFINTMRLISKLLKDSKVHSVEQLRDKPVEVTFKDGLLKEWRILTEVI